MVRSFLKRVCVVSAGTLAAGVIAGCAATTVSENLPPPNFNAPPIAQPVYVPAPVTPPPAPRTSPAPRPAVAAFPREWTPSVRPNAWRWIVIHHSATPSGSVGAFDRMHKQKGWDECGYHFVIGNGSGSGDGQVEVGPRWPKQKWGAHAKTADNRFNEYGIGICLVGNFEQSRPTARQQQALARLVAHLMQAYNVPPDRVLGHQDTGKQTACPGRNMNISVVRRNAGDVLASWGAMPRPAGQSPSASAGELLQPVR